MAERTRTRPARGEHRLLVMLQTIAADFTKKIASVQPERRVRVQICRPTLRCAPTSQRDMPAQRTPAVSRRVGGSYRQQGNAVSLAIDVDAPGPDWSRGMLPSHDGAELTSSAETPRSSESS